MANHTVPAYVSLLDNGRFDERLRRAFSRMRCCDLCPRRCRVDRLRGNRGAWCHTADSAIPAELRRARRWAEKCDLWRLTICPSTGRTPESHDHLFMV